MAFNEIVEKISSSRSYGFPAAASKRYKRLDAYERLLCGTLYDHIATSFDTNVTGGNYIKVTHRKPSIVYNLAKVVVDQHASLAFGEAHFPSVRCKPNGNKAQTDRQKRTQDACAALIQAMKLPAIMQTAVFRGSIGSVALIAKILDDGEPHVDVVSGKNAIPSLDPSNPSRLNDLERIWTVDGETLQLYGYAIDKEDLEKTFWLRLTVAERELVWYLPLKDEEYAKLGDEDESGKRIEWRVDERRTGVHGFDQAPTVWIRNLLFGDDAIDGPCTFACIADICVKLDYQLSQMDRGLRYSMDPLLVIKTGDVGAAALELANRDRSGNLALGAGTALPLQGENVDASILETQGHGFEAVRENIKMLREYGLEVAGGMKSDQDHATGPQSGSAIENLIQTVIWYVERVRIAYGDNGLVPLLRILLRALAAGKIDLKDGEDWSGIDAGAPLSLVWPKWKIPTGIDLANEMQGYQLAVGGSVKDPVPLISPQVGSRLVAQTLDLDDPNEIAEDAEKFRDEQDAKDQEAATQSHEQAMEMQQVKAAVKPAKGSEDA